MLSFIDLFVVYTPSKARSRGYRGIYPPARRGARGYRGIYPPARRGARGYGGCIPQQGAMGGYISLNIFFYSIYNLSSYY